MSIAPIVAALFISFGRVLAEEVASTDASLAASALNSDDSLDKMMSSLLNTNSFFTNSDNEADAVENNDAAENANTGDADEDK